MTFSRQAPRRLRLRPRLPPPELARGPALSNELATSWRLFSALPVERVEIVVNGAVVHTESGLAASGSRIITGDLELPAGGWIAVRAHGGEVMWPAMDSYPFAHTAPIWIGERASTEPGARQRAATELRAALDVAERRLLQAYGEAEIPRLRQRFTDARRRLEELGAAAAGESGGS